MSPSNQRWRERRASFRIATEPIDVRRYGVELIDGDRETRTFVERHHYSGSYPAARVRVGLFRARSWVTPELVGVAVFGVPQSEAVLPKWTGYGNDGAVELSRFVLLDDVEGNGETWFLARAFRLLRAARPELRAVLAFSDPVERRTDDGRVVTPGHVGTIYQALNGRHVGRANPATKYQANGRDLPKRVLDKVMTGDQGARYSRDVLLAAGAPAQLPGEGDAAYVVRARAAFRRYRHPGCLAYVWPLVRGVVFPRETQAYPKASAIVRAA